MTVTSAWPREPPAVPVVLVTLAGERAADRRDDRWYLTELEYYVRVFAAKSGELRRVVAAVDDAMRALGYDPGLPLGRAGRRLAAGGHALQNLLLRRGEPPKPGARRARGSGRRDSID